MRVGVTGAAGYVGSRLVEWLRAAGLDVVPIVRGASNTAGSVAVGDLADAAVARHAGTLGRLDAMVHLAARTAAGREDDDAGFGRQNVDGTRGALELAAAAGAAHFVFVSTIKVHGDTSPRGRPFDEGAPRRPGDAYARSKVQAEDFVTSMAPRAGLAWTIIRPPLIYGPDAAANFATLARLAGSGLPLPLGGIANRRSLLFTDNLCDFIAHVLDASAARGETFLVADSQDVSTSSLIRSLAAVTGRRARLIPIPAGLAAAVARMAGRGALADRLFADLAIERGKAERLLGWTPPVPLPRALAQSFPR